MPRYSNQNLRELSEQGLGAKLTPAKPRKAQANDEWKIERKVRKWWLVACVAYNIPSCLYFSVPNGTALGFGKEEWQKKGSAIRGRMMKLIGLEPGIPDKILAVPRKGHGALFIEFKTPVGVVSDEQKKAQEALIGMGYRVCVCRSADEAIEAITNYLT